jgi:hypothetical protein
MTDKIAIVGLVIALLSGVAVPVGLALLDRGGTSDAAAPSPSGGLPADNSAVSSTASTTSTPADDPPPGGATGPSSVTFDGKNLDLAEDSYADLDSGQVGDDDLFRREADLALRSLDLAAAVTWDYHSKVQMALAGDDVTSPGACARATRVTRKLADQEMRVGTKLCVRSNGGRMFLLRVEQLPTYDTQPPVLVLRIA